MSRSRAAAAVALAAAGAASLAVGDHGIDAEGGAVGTVDGQPEFVASESDERTINNADEGAAGNGDEGTGNAGADAPAGNAVRHAYRVLTDEEKALMVRIKDLGAELLETIGSIGSSRELSIAATKTEEAVMWAVKHITA